MIKKILFFLILFPLMLWSQKDSIFNGKIVSESSSLDEIHIINITKNSGVLSERGGYFKIRASVNDTLMFSAVHLKGYQRVVLKQDFENDLVFIPMEVFENQLTGITLTKYKNINAESLGIVPKGQKRYSPAERKLVTAGDFRWYSPLLIPVGGMSVDGLINAISGRTNMLKKELVVERKELLQEKTSNFFTKEYITNTLKIPEEYVEGFLFYIVEDKRFTNEMKNENKAMATFILGELADEYLKLKELDVKKNKDENEE
ncbi:hypothetical protein FIA58_012225 [Flavobacterium jejuense]|uniref:Carboxypeptidase-like regulatory domain-containing protein n=1 Tax=Flavobacterium jejuense TaxID=1544455 RepID=A0ABX0IRH3_9FLAO|nr:hypothetical protein [Flavobacterium jejuense]NHN26444.1 hypothetical protein [Flavobacterium jejuense]